MLHHNIQESKTGVTTVYTTVSDDTREIVRAIKHLTFQVDRLVDVLKRMNEKESDKARCAECGKCDGACQE